MSALRAIAVVLSVLVTGLAPSEAPLVRAEVTGAGARGRVSRGLKIATWNLAWLNRAVGTGEVPRSPEDYDRLREYARKLSADVVALQEVDGEEAARRVFDPKVYAFHFTRDVDQVQRSGFAYRKDLVVTPNPDLVELAMAGKRRGADVSVAWAGRSIRLLCVHLKSGCAAAPLETDSEACRTLRAQLPALESWIDARAREGIPFGVLGDFNRRLGPSDPFWREIDDGVPSDADLIDAGDGIAPACWRGRHPEFIDHVVLGKRAAGWIVPDSFHELLYEESGARLEAALSDHCPIAVTIHPLGALRSPRVLGGGEAALHVGEVARVCGPVASARYLEREEGRPTFLNLDRPYPDQTLTVVVWGNARAAFGEPEIAFAGKRICVTGTIETFRGRPQIVARRREQIEVGPGRTGHRSGTTSDRPSKAAPRRAT